ncbi:hypothetical protein L6164_020751 [Bauhinia variegata]|uniref:Uncharacterized protein n=1 Tax=Bauhinia variegata TaxID=167791 RepID=A0ACB9MWD8_BAUVA|nr:hypothetical protein L6164_020751 [Bauhinia variegata]
MRFKSPPLFHRYARIIWTIKDYLERDWNVDLAHILREENSCADFLAKLGAANAAPIQYWGHPSWRS